MPKPRPRASLSGRASVHLTLPADVAARLRAFAGWRGVDLSAVVADMLRRELRGFAVRDDRPGVRDRPDASASANAIAEGEGADP